MVDAKRVARMRREARDAVNKRGLVQFRADAKLIDRLYAEAGKLGLPVGTMVRMWVMERLNKQQKRGSG